MKKIVILFLAFVCIITSSYSQDNIWDLHAKKIADRMKDSLSLTGVQRNELYIINVHIHEAKTNARKDNRSDENVLTLQVQKIENTRDSLYRQVLGESKYILYKEKKRFLVTAL